CHASAEVLQARAKQRSPDGGSILYDESAFHPLVPPPISRPPIRICVHEWGTPTTISDTWRLRARGERPSPRFHQASALSEGGLRQSIPLRRCTLHRWVRRPPGQRCSFQCGGSDSRRRSSGAWIID